MKRGWKFYFAGLTVTVFNANLDIAMKGAKREARIKGLSDTILEMVRLH